MSSISKPNTFSANTTISSSEVNANFDTIYNAFNGSVDAANLASGAVTTAKIADSNVTTAKIADSNVTTAKIADSNVTTAKMGSRDGFFATVASQTFTSGVTAIVQCGTELYDEGGNYDNTTYKYTVPYDGYFFGGYQIVFDGSADNSRYEAIILRDRSSTLHTFGYDKFSGQSTQAVCLNNTSLIPVSAGDTLAFYAQSIDATDAIFAATLNIVGDLSATDYQNTFWGYMIGKS